MKVNAVIITEDNKRVLVPSRKHIYHNSIQLAIRKLEGLRIAGRGIVFKCGTDGNDVNNWLTTIAL